MLLHRVMGRYRLGWRDIALTAGAGLAPGRSEGAREGRPYCREQSKPQWRSRGVRYNQEEGAFANNPV